MSNEFLHDQRLVDLMIQRTIDGLDAPARDELRCRAGLYGDYDDYLFDRIAAALTLAVIEIPPLPRHMRERLEVVADQRLAQGQTDVGSGAAPAGPGRDGAMASAQLGRSPPFRHGR